MSRGPARRTATTRPSVTCRPWQLRHVAGPCRAGRPGRRHSDSLHAQRTRTRSPATPAARALVRQVLMAQPPPPRAAFFQAQQREQVQSKERVGRRHMRCASPLVFRPARFRSSDASVRTTRRRPVLPPRVTVEEALHQVRVEALGQQWLAAGEWALSPIALRPEQAPARQAPPLALVRVPLPSACGQSSARVCGPHPPSRGPELP